MNPLIGSTARFVAHGMTRPALKQMPGALASAFRAAPKASDSAMFKGLAQFSSGVKDSKSTTGSALKERLSSMPAEKDASVVIRYEPRMLTPSAHELQRSIVADMPSHVPGLDELMRVSSTAFLHVDALDPYSDEASLAIDAMARIRELAILQKDMGPEEFGALLKKESRQLFETLAQHVPQDGESGGFIFSRRIDASSTTSPVLWQPPGPPLTLKDGSTVNSRQASGLDAGAVASFLRGLGTASYESRFPQAESSDVARRNLGYGLASRSGTGRRDLILAENDKREVMGFADLDPANADTLGQLFAERDKTGVVKNVPTCEVSLVTGDAHQGKGLGRALLAQAIKSAKEAGFGQMTAVVSKDNAAMLKLLGEAGIKTHVPARTDGYLHFVADLAKLG